MNIRKTYCILAAASLALSGELQAQVVGSLQEGITKNGVVTTVREGAVSEGDYAAEGIINDWKETLRDFENSKEDYASLDNELNSIRASAAGKAALNKFVGRDGRTYELPQAISPEGIDLYLLSPEGITIYMAFDAPAYMQDIDDNIIKWIRYYAYSKRANTKRIFSRYQEWEPRIKAYFESAGVPPELAELCLVESGCTYKAKSPVGALGMWQIMPDTGRAYGMLINGAVDERLDPVKSTITAAKILLRNYERIGEWTLAAAAYNCGPGRFINGQNKGVPWSAIKDKLPKETQQYIPCLIAIHYVWTYRVQLGF